MTDHVEESAPEAALCEERMQRRSEHNAWLDHFGRRRGSADASHVESSRAKPVAESTIREARAMSPASASRPRGLSVYAPRFDSET